MAKVTAKTWDAVWQIIVDVRDAYPRTDDDAPTDEIVEALINAGLIADGDDRHGNPA